MARDSVPTLMYLGIHNIFPSLWAWWVGIDEWLSKWKIDRFILFSYGLCFGRRADVTLFRIWAWRIGDGLLRN